MTHDPEEANFAETLTEQIPSSRRRFTRTDKIVAALTVLALASPFVARGIASAGASSQIAQPGDISEVRPIDIALGYKEEQAEAAFFEGLEQPQSILAGSAEAAFGLALADDEWPDVDPVLPIVESLIPAKPEIDTANIAATSDDDVEVADSLQGPGDIWSRPPKSYDEDDPKSEDEFTAEVEIDEIPKRREIATAPPNQTPLPEGNPKRGQRSVAVQEPKKVLVSLKDPAKPIVITETPLAPPSEEPTRVAMAEIIPTITTPDAPARQSKIQLQPQNGVKPRIALVITAAGINSEITESAIESLPAGITLAFAPVKKEAGALAEKAKQDGHTVLVEIPMEPVNKRRDPGPMTLRVADPVEQNIDRLEEALARIPVATGASSYLGARFNAVEDAADPIVQTLAKRGMFFFENQPTQRSVFERLSVRSKLPYAKGVIVIDRSKSSTAIRASLDALEVRARERGIAIGVGSTLRATVSTVALWAKEAQKRGVEFVPIMEAR